MNRHYIGPCTACGKKIWEMVDNKLMMTEEGTHFWIRSNFNTVAKFAICKDCIKTLDKAKVAEIVDGQVYTWLDDLFKDNGEVNRYLFNKYRFYVALDFADNEEEIIEKCKLASS